MGLCGRYSTVTVHMHEPAVRLASLNPCCPCNDTSRRVVRRPKQPATCHIQPVRLLARLHARSKYFHGTLESGVHFQLMGAMHQCPCENDLKGNRAFSDRRRQCCKKRVPTNLGLRSSAKTAQQSRRYSESECKARALWMY